MISGYDTFHNSQKPIYKERSIQKALEAKQVTLQDIDLIDEYVNEKRDVKRKIGFARELKITCVQLLTHFQVRSF